MFAISATVFEAECFRLSLYVQKSYVIEYHNKYEILYLIEDICDKTRISSEQPI